MLALMAKIGWLTPEGPAGGTTEPRFLAYCAACGAKNLVEEFHTLLT